MSIARVGQEFVVYAPSTGAFTENDQVTALSGGGFAVTYEINGSGPTGISLDASAYFDNSAESFQQLSTESVDFIDAQALAALPDDQFVDVWATDNEDVLSRTYSANPAEGSLEAGDIAPLESDAVSPAVTALTGGGIIILWAINEGNGSSDIAGEFVKPNNAGLTRVTLTTGGQEGAPVVAPLADDNAYVAVWQSDDGGTEAIRGHVFDGQARTDFVVNSTASIDLQDAAVAELSDGGFVVTWDSARPSTGDFEIRGRVFDANGVPVGSDFAVSTEGESQDSSSVAALADGRFVVTWTSSDASDNTQIRARLFNDDGTADGSDFIVNDSGERGESSSVAALNDDHFVVTWRLITAVTVPIQGAIFDPTMFTGTSGADVWQGGSLADTISGGDGNDTLSGLGGADTIDGGTGADKMTGGSGNDTYVVDNSGDQVIEAVNGGTDLVKSSISYTLGANVENLTLTGTGNINGTGNSLANVLVGNAGANVLNGEGGADTMQGGAGNDTYVVDVSGDQVIEAANGGTDLVESAISYTLGANLENLTLTGTANINGTGNALANVIVGNSGINVLTGGDGSDTYVVQNAGDTVVEAANAGTDLIESSVAYTLPANVENLTLTGTANINGTGNSLANVIVGNAGANELNGEGGADTMQGGAGNDIYVVDSSGDQVIEAANAGTDLVGSAVTFTLPDNVENLVLTGSSAIDGTGNALDNDIDGNAAVNVLGGGDGDDILNGGGGADTLEGGRGDDTYVVDDTGDQVVEASGQGTDHVDSAVSFTLSANVENLTLTGTASINGTGNTLANVIVGNAVANVLNGEGGADTMEGGAGNDTYVVDNAHDKVVEAANGGTDRVESGASFILSANVENLILTGSGHINGTGNALANVITGNAAANVLVGAAGADTLNGGGGADIMQGGGGNDTYVVDNRGDQVVEAAHGGSDLVRSAVSFTLSANIEDLTLTGKEAINATGNALANVIVGNAAANHLDGGAGHDTLTGGGGNDIFRFDAKLAPTNTDTITDFTHGHDRIELDHALFVGLAQGKLAAAAFVVDTTGKATGPDQHIIYDNKTGGLFYDQDGTGTAHDPVEFAILKGHPTIDAGDFLVI